MQSNQLKSNYMEDSPMYKRGKTLTTIKELNDKLKDLIYTQSKFSYKTDPEESRLVCELIRETKQMISRMYISTRGL